MTKFARLSAAVAAASLAGAVFAGPALAESSNPFGAKPSTSASPSATQAPGSSDQLNKLRDKFQGSSMGSSNGQKSTEAPAPGANQNSSNIKITSTEKDGSGKTFGIVALIAVILGALGAGYQWAVSQGLLPKFPA